MTLYTEDEIVINAPATKVWEALIKPEMTRQYMFGCEVICSWNIGDTIEWKGMQDGVVYVKGHLVKFDPLKEFSFTVFDPHASYPDKPENYLTARYKLQDKGGHTVLKVSQGDYASVAEGEKRYQDTLEQGGWSTVLESLKKIVENS